MAVDVVLAEVPLLISKKTSVSAHGQLGFTIPILPIEENVIIQLTNLPSGHVGRRGAFVPPSSEILTSNVPEHRQLIQASAQTALKLYPYLKDHGVTPSSDVGWAKANLLFAQ